MQQQTPNLTQAIIAVMQSIAGIEKSMTVGVGNNAYKGVSDKDVKNIVGDAMAKNGLCIVPIDVEIKSQVERWTETGGQYGDKQKQSIFSEVKTKYLLMHTSGESIELAGCGHGVDTQDKGAGKATTYALKYTLLYTFLVPTGKIDDADATHSDTIDTPVKSKPVLNPKSEKWSGAVASLASGKTTIDAIEKVYVLSKNDREILLLSAV